MMRAGPAQAIARGALDAFAFPDHPDIDKMLTGGELAAIRTHLGNITQAELARRIGKSERSVQAYESDTGKAIPRTVDRAIRWICAAAVR